MITGIMCLTLIPTQMFAMITPGPTSPTSYGLFSLIVITALSSTIMAYLIFKLTKNKYTNQLHIHQNMLNKQKEKNKTLIVQLKKEKASNEKVHHNFDMNRKLQNAFLANISHEIRTPLNGIIGFTSIIKNDASLSNEKNTEKNCDFVLSCGYRLNSYIENIIEISRIQANETDLHLEPCNLHEILDLIIDENQFLLNQKELKISVEAVNLPPVKGDKKYLFKILGNIVENAVKYTNEGEINISFPKNSSSLTIAIKDTGIGIDEEYLNLIYQPFSQESKGITRDYEGGGLGLPITKNLIELHNGTIGIKSKKGKGTVVTIQLPIYHEMNGMVYCPTQPNIELGTIESKTLPSILVVEDDEMNAELMRAYLRETADVTIAEDGEEAIIIIQEWANKRRYFDLLLIDINLPGRWTGTSLMKEIKNRWQYYRKIPILCQTAHALHGDKENLLQHGFTDYVPKPINRKELLVKIRHFCKISRGESKLINAEEYGK